MTDTFNIGYQLGRWVHRLETVEKKLEVIESRLKRGAIAAVLLAIGVFGNLSVEQTTEIMWAAFSIIF